MFGKKRTKNFMRLLKPVFKGETVIQVEMGLDLVPGDKISILSSSISPNDVDVCYVLAYDQ